MPFLVAVGLCPAPFISLPFPPDWGLLDQDLDQDLDINLYQDLYQDLDQDLDQGLKHSNQF